MGLESATYIDDLITTNPVSSDNTSQGDDHLRLLKTILKATFPNADKAFYFPTTVAKTADFTVADTDLNNLFLVDTSGGDVDVTLPTLTTSDKGWFCELIKTTTDAYAYFIYPDTGTIQSGEYSGLSYCRRCIPGRRTKVFWTGTAWMAERVESSPVGAIIDFCGSSIPVGYELPYGQTIASASSRYPEFYSVNGDSAVAPDLRGRAVFGKDNMGGSAASRITSAGSSITGTTLGATGGAQTVSIAKGNIPSYNLTLSSFRLHYSNSVSVNSTHTFVQSVSPSNIGVNAKYYAGPDYDPLTGVNEVYATVTSSGTASGYTDYSGNLSISSGGGGTALNKMPPTIVLNKLLVTE